LASWISRGDHRLALLLIGGYFVLGLAILAGIDVGRGRSAALAADA
jgi:UMF1 family MFS transporter